MNPLVPIDKYNAPLQPGYQKHEWELQTPFERIISNIFTLCIAEFVYQCFVKPMWDEKQAILLNQTNSDLPAHLNPNGDSNQANGNLDTPSNPAQPNNQNNEVTEDESHCTPLSSDSDEESSTEEVNHDSEEESDFSEVTTNSDVASSDTRPRRVHFADSSSSEHRALSNDDELEEVVLSHEATRTSEDPIDEETYEAEVVLSHEATRTSEDPIDEETYEAFVKLFEEVEAPTSRTTSFQSTHVNFGDVEFSTIENEPGFEIVSHLDLVPSRQDFIGAIKKGLIGNHLLEANDYIYNLHIVAKPLDTKNLKVRTFPESGFAAGAIKHEGQLYAVQFRILGKKL